MMNIGIFTFFTQIIVETIQALKSFSDDGRNLTAIANYSMMGSYFFYFFLRFLDCFYLFILGWFIILFYRKLFNFFVQAHDLFLHLPERLIQTLETINLLTKFGIYFFFLCFFFFNLLRNINLFLRFFNFSNAFIDSFFNNIINSVFFFRNF
eukprot:TRINITY_DN27428_c0_g1_i1.p1 TRINITY_DN27428_c0_g1~~TRINITY_DN27428_c0_g1_i1.p1  ORF type:complete len:152 (+),score=5.52 TRINITY_DN27428_c0_g1_i1:295-750(+)